MPYVCFRESGKQSHAALDILLEGRFLIGSRDTTKENLQGCPGQCFMGLKNMEEKEGMWRNWANFLEVVLCS